VLSLGALVLLLVFIDHVTKLIQVSNLAARIGNDTSAEIRRLARKEDESVDAAERVLVWRSAGRGLPVHVRRAGYLRSVDVATITRRLNPFRARVVLFAGAGDLVAPDEAVAEVWIDESDATRADDEKVTDAVLVGVHVANERDLHDDPGFGVRQLADIAIRALSPGMNDPTTAVTCIAYVRAALIEELALLPRDRLVESDEVQIVLAPRGFERDAGALAEIAHHARGDARASAAIEQAVAAVTRSARDRGRAEEAARVEAEYHAARAAA
jgi:uncharacterized membrane protein